MGARDLKNLVPLLGKYNAQADLQPPPPEADLRARQVPGTAGCDEARSHMLDVVQRFVRAWTYKDMPWLEAQEAGLLWAPLRKPHENALDEHWRTRKTFAEIEHPELGRSFLYPTSKWLSSKTSWQVGRRAPLLGEDTEAVLGEAARRPSVPAEPRRVENPRRSALHDKPFPLQGIKIFDFAWFLASAGGTRFLAAMGAESYKVEWKDNPDTRLAGMAPVGGRAARDAATGPLPGVKDPDMGGNFLNKNSGKRGISLNIRHPKGLADRQGHDPHLRCRGRRVLARRPAAPRPRLRRAEVDPPGHHLHPAIRHGRARHLWPHAHGRAGGGGVRRAGRDVRPAGAGDAGELGLFLPRLDGRLRLCAGIARRDLPPRAHRRRPVDRRLAMRKRHFPDRRDDPRLGGQRAHLPPLRQPLAVQAGGAARRLSLQGKDRWIAIACFTDAEWQALARVAEQRAWLDDRRFATLDSRLQHQDALDAAVEAWTRTQDRYDCMMKLQKAGVPAGVCQNAEDRVDTDPQLRHLKWLTEVTGTKIGTWPVYEIPMKLSKTPAYIGGPINRGAPCYGEDNFYVLTELLGRTPSEVERLAEEGVI